MNMAPGDFIIPALRMSLCRGSFVFKNWLEKEQTDSSEDKSSGMNRTFSVVVVVVLAVVECCGVWRALEC